ncbi:hypothetical protein LNJ08_11925 [Tenacibaculum finnmarkense genomovar ulcerans]|uniref:HNH/endonuclease VII fold putative polymorphic toxin n=1 Tax=Tenacibaculum finnmarkense TaxID=2781243 RepID=UPI001E292124|nr:HNH/endonuclease VII fold putative polymorphic toxin [Tenacibaculum finnmarkense]MCD8455098.1 hypothetical protein [Tenacibaculum finnmarkense genomovar ulcerans]
MYNEEGETTWERSLDSNGKVKTGDNSSCPFLFQGQYYDAEIELAYNRFRYYNPDDGRYISVDPIGLLSGEFGFYNYVGDSNGWVDVYGLAKSYANPKKNKKTSHNSDSKKAAFRQAKRDAEIPMSQQPFKVERPDLDDGYGNLIMKDGVPVTSREYHFKNRHGKTVIIQEHSLGHTKATPNHGKEPHYNTRDLDGLGEVNRTGSYPGTHGHYNF